MVNTLQRVMQFSIIIILLLSTLYSMGVAASSETLSSNMPSDKCVMTFAGTIGQDIKIQMRFQRQSNTLCGLYFYEKYQKNLRITGTVDPDGSFVLNEYILGGSQSGKFIGKFLNQNTMEGIWSDPEHQREYPFTLERKALIEQNRHTQEGIQYQLIREPTQDGDVLKLKIENKNLITLGQQCLTLTCLSGLSECEDCVTEVNTVRIDRIVSSPGLYHIQWRATPFGYGKLHTYCSYVVTGGKDQDILFRNCFDERNETWGDKWNISRSSEASYFDNHLLMTDSYLCNSFQGGKIVTQEDSWLYRTYEITQEGLKLLNAEELLKASSTGQQIKNIPIPQALKKYPAINTVLQ